MQHHGEPAGQRDLGFASSAASGNAKGSGSQPVISLGAGHHDVGNWWPRITVRGNCNLIYSCPSLESYASVEKRDVASWRDPPLGDVRKQPGEAFGSVNRA